MVCQIYQVIVAHSLTVNYDTSIELMCELSGNKYTDGFEPYWNPRTFEDKTKLHLYKLHGSCTWYSSGTKYLKIPVAPLSENLQLLGGKSTENIVLYPTAIKNQTSEPLSYLMSEFRKTLYEINILFIVGYSCRDDEISRVLAEAVHTNPNLFIFIISPHPEKCIKRLANIDERLQHVCVGISTTWKAILNNNNIGKMINDFSYGLNGFLQAKTMLRSGKSYYQNQINNYELSLRRAFLINQMLELFSIHDSRLKSGKLDKHEYHQSQNLILEISLGLLYDAILMQQMNRVPIYAKAILNWLDYRIRDKNPNLTFISFINDMNNNLNQDEWFRGCLYEYFELIRYNLNEWAKWISPFLINEVFNDNLIRLVEAIHSGTEDFELLEEIRGYLQAGGPKDTNYLESPRRIKRIFPNVRERITGLPSEDEFINSVKPGNEATILKEKWRKNQGWINSIYSDSILQLKTIVSILEKLSVISK